MKLKQGRPSALLATLLTGAGLVVVSGIALAGISNTKHNLSSTQTTATNNHTTSTGDICVFCHTPHGADISNPNSNPPLWNKALPSTASYQTYAALNSASIDGQILAVGSVSVACLSCHDGTQAMDNIINAPGSGGYDSTGGGTNGRNFAWVGNTVSAEGIMTNPTGGINVALMGTDLRNDHPIGIQYCGGGLSGSGTTVSGTCSDPDFKNGTTGVKTTLINGVQYFWVDTAGGTANRDRSDMILFTRTFSGGAGPSVECASCHDPHVESGTTSGGLPVAGETFLRISNTGSAVCLSCHVK
jgi:hypothetical protein